ncbi:glycoside hydrolase family 127 protein [Marisediminicola senii]|uniref:glycoside hydrolase family 127 protein n=1 Tax=Marisediminicola senii TaxID=2711233 RepID=UPI0013EB0B24|nr:beta-L-arabinofuranosidase domain-containing protein [Marisediminicola senii]
MVFTEAGTGPVRPTTTAIAALRPAAVAEICGGFWGARLAANREVGIRDGFRQLHEAGNVENLEAAASTTAPLRPGQRIDGAASGLDAASQGYRGPVFMDSDVYKWLEAAAWESQREADATLDEQRAVLGAAVAAAQKPNGYLNSFVQVVTGAPWADLAVSHELYCLGHLSQAAVAASRGAADDTLLEVTARAADLLDTTFGPGLTTRVDGHPIIEMALVELFRQTGERRYLDLATWAVDRRGRSEHHGRDFDFTYFSDRVPVREATTLEGHAVRALYLASGATDVAVETGDRELLAALELQWENVVESKTYITGGMGSRWEGESFGAPFELPSDRAYAETCAAIASIQWSWRLLLATGRARYAHLIERTLYNGMLAGVGLSGDEFFYANPLQVRTGDIPASSISPALGRQRWFSTACCPPNVMRTLAQLGHYVATTTDDGVQVHQYVAGTIRSETLTLEVTGDYPYDGDIAFTVAAASGEPQRLSLRIPAWAAGASWAVESVGSVGSFGEGAGPAARHDAPAGDYLVIERVFAPGDVVRLSLPLEVRATTPHARVDAVRGSVALERGPLVYCVEQADQPAGDEVDDTMIPVDAAASITVRSEPDLLGGTTTLTFDDAVTGTPRVAVPYALWANRGSGAMRVWLPTA